MSIDSQLTRKTKGAVLAFVVAPPLAAAVQAVLALTLATSVGGLRAEMGYWRMLGFSFLGILIFSHGATIVVGIPGYVLWRYKGWIRRRS